MSLPDKAPVLASSLPLRHDDPITLALVLKIMVCTALLLGATYLLLRWQATRTNSARRGATAALSCVTSLRLSPRSTVYLLRVEQSLVLVSESASGSLTVTELAAAPKPLSGLAAVQDAS